MKHSDKGLTRTEVTVALPSDGGDRDDAKRKAYAMMRDVGRYPEYMPSVIAIDIFKQNESELTTRWDAEIDGAPIRWVQTVLCKDAEQEMVFEAIEGDFDVFRGKWSVIESEGQIYLKLLVEYKLGIPVIEEVLGPILKEKVRANSEAMLGAIVSQL
jgi:ribosome-associated toxin RatA of RatAB toxin-antitoxin module